MCLFIMPSYVLVYPSPTHTRQFKPTELVCYRGASLRDPSCGCGLMSEQRIPEVCVIGLLLGSSNATCLQRSIDEWSVVVERNEQGGDMLMRNRGTTANDTTDSNLTAMMSQSSTPASGGGTPLAVFCYIYILSTQRRDILGNQGISNEPKSMEINI